MSDSTRGNVIDTPDVEIEITWEEDEETSVDVYGPDAHINGDPYALYTATGMARGTVWASLGLVSFPNGGSPWDWASEERRREVEAEVARDMAVNILDEAHREDAMREIRRILTTARATHYVDRTGDELDQVIRHAERAGLIPAQ